MSYTVPNTTTLGEVLGLQHAHAPGISTRQNTDGTWELTGWPVSLGSVPTQSQVNQWVENIAANRQAAKNASVKSSLRANDDATVKLRACLKVVMSSMVETRATLNAVLSAVGAASDFANLKTRVAAISALTNRTWAQVLAAVDSVVDSGQGEE